MTIDPSSTTTGSCSTDHASRAKIKSDFQALSGDLQAGNLGGAQTDFATLLQDAPQLQTALQTAGTMGSNPLSALSSALNSGDLAGAQTAMTTLQQSVHGHHHHHHHPQPDNDQDDAGQSPAAATSPGSSSSAANGVTL